MRFGDLYIYNLSRRWFESFGSVVYEHAPINVWRLCLHTPLPEKVAFGGWPLEDDGHYCAYARAVPSARDARLLFHQKSAAILSGFRVNLVLQVEGWRAFLVRVSKDAYAVKLDCTHKFKELLKIFFRFAGEARDEGRAHCDAGHALSHAANQSFKALARPAPAHQLQHVRRSML